MHTHHVVMWRNKKQAIVLITLLSRTKVFYHQIWEMRKSLVIEHTRTVKEFTRSKNYIKS